MSEKDFGFVAPEVISGGYFVKELAEEPEADPFEQLVEEPLDQEHDEDAPEGEVFQNLEEEYRILASLKKRKDELTAAQKEASAEYEAHRGRMLRAMRAQGTRQFRSTTVERGACHFNNVYSVKVKDPETFMEWVREHAPELQTVNSQTLAKHVREEFRNRGVPPEDPSFPPGLEVKEIETLTVNVPKER